MDALAQPLVKSVTEVIAAKEKKEEDRRPFTIAGAATISSLSAYVENAWRAAYEAKSAVQTRMAESTRQLRGEYDADKLAEIMKFGGSQQYINATLTKSRGTSSWVKDINKEASSPFSIAATPLPELSPEDEEQITAQMAEEYLQGSDIPLADIEAQIKEELMAELKKAADEKMKRLKTKILDEQAEGGWSEAIDDFISDVVNYPAGFLKGPVFVNEPVNEWVKDENGRSRPSVVNKILKKWKRVSPYMMYPSPASRDINDGYLFEHHLITRGELYSMKGLPGYDDAAIDRVLGQDNHQKLSDWLVTAKQANEAEATAPNLLDKGPETKIDALEYWGHIRGKDLLEFGVSKNRITDSNKMYFANVWKIGSEIIKAILNPHPLGKKPYFRTSMAKITGSFWGMGVPEMMKDIQDIINAIIRHMINNVAMASGPQVYKDTARMELGENPYYIAPWQVHPYDSSSATMGTTSGAPIGFFQPDMQAAQLMRLFQFFKELADEYTGIPAYTYGVANVGSAGKTASGLSMLITAAGKVIGNVMMAIDKDVIVPAVKYHHDLLMLFDEDESIKGDMNIVAGGVTTLVAKEQQLIRLTEFSNIINNPTDNRIIGIKGRAHLLRMIMQQFPIDVNDVIPTDDEIEAMLKQEQLLAQQEATAEGMTTPPNAKELSLAGEKAAGGDHALFTDQNRGR